MPLSTQQLQATFARRREIESARAERVEAVNQYYNHWNKVTNRYANWTNPAYYKQAEEKLQHKRENIAKEKQLKERRDKLRDLFAEEKKMYEQEIKEARKPKARKINTDTDTLERVYSSTQDRENIKRKLELEAKLYGKMRHGKDDDKILFESKTDNQVLAKLNWLDKQIDDQMQREKDEAIAQERNLRLQQEINIAQQAQKERQEIREREIKEICALQERHMTELKERQTESEHLKMKEKELRDNLEEVGKEFELINSTTKLVFEHVEPPQAYNLNKIKVAIRKRADVYTKLLQLCIDLLKRVESTTTKREVVQTLIKKYQTQLSEEALTLKQIESMYESEAKLSLQRCEKKWRDEHLQRYTEIKNALTSVQLHMSKELDDNMQRQNDILDIRAAHLSSIESSNDKLKELMKEKEDTEQNSILHAVADTEAPKDCSTAQTPTPTVTPMVTPRVTPRPALTNMLENTNANSHANTPNSSQPSSGANTPRAALSSESVKSLLPREERAITPRITKSFENLNIGDDDVQSVTSNHSLQYVTSETAQRPKFARKKVAWN